MSCSPRGGMTSRSIFRTDGFKKSWPCIRRRIPSGGNQWAARHPRLAALPLFHRWAASPCLDLHAWVRRLGLDLWFCPMTNLDPRHLAIPTVVTVADIQQEYYPEFFTREELQARALMYGPSCQEATAVIAVSEFSKRCMVEKYSLASEKVHCVYEACEQIDDPASWLTVEQLRLKYHLPERYAFYPANMWPHKNQSPPPGPASPAADLRDVAVAGLNRRRHGGWGELEAVARHFHLHEDIHYLGYVPADGLPGLYRAPHAPTLTV